MSDETNNNDAGEQPGWASSDTPTPADPSIPVSTPPIPDQPVPGPIPNPAMSQNSFPTDTPMAQPKKKSKLWLWITLAIGIPLLLCGIGVIITVALVVGATKPAVDATNNFYKAAKNGSNLNSLTCEIYRKHGGNFNNDMKTIDLDYGKIHSYSFRSVSNDNGDVTVKGTVKRDDGVYAAVVHLDKESGKYKVCNLRETP